ncbi:MAG: hypothetical protein CMP16_03460 [Rickettsiales bacterium]|nr:hypothetical protein [Rickettsiales bacterium]
MFYKIIKYLVIKNFLYKIYLLVPTKKEFEGIQNFNVAPIKKKSLNTLLKINEDYFSSNPENKIPLEMHSFDWLNDFKKTGGINLLKKARHLILDWKNCDFNLSSNVWNELLIAKRIINLSTNFDYYGTSANKEFKTITTNLIFFHYKNLLFLKNLYPEKYDIDLEVSKSLLLTSSFFGKKNDFYKLINFIKKQTVHQINKDGFHKSINIFEQAKFINNLIEIKNILLFNKNNSWSGIDNIIIEMTSVLKNFFHKDQTLPLFNATNNKQIDYVRYIANLQKDLKVKKLFEIKDGIVVVEASQTKVFFDVTKPNSKLLNKRMHSGTLSFEMSHDNEKIITNCGSPEKYLGKNQVFFRYSAAHSTLTINNTNISELSEKNGYKRIPKNIKNSSEEKKDFYKITASHDGYKNNYGVLIRRSLKISKNGLLIFGSDEILNLKKVNKNNTFEIRFHLMPGIASALTNNDEQVILKLKNGMAWYLRSENNKLRIDESLYMGSGSQPLASTQIVIYGSISKLKNVVKWELKKVT